jgi:hypothetical protein
MRDDTTTMTISVIIVIGATICLWLFSYLIIITIIKDNIDFGVFLIYQCLHECRVSVLSKWIHRYPESLARVDERGWLPLHWVVSNQSSSIDSALFIIEKYPEALRRPNSFGNLPLHIECRYQRRLAVISKCIVLYPESLAIADEHGNFPLHFLFREMTSSVDSALLVIEKYPEALRHQNSLSYLPIHIECQYQCRLSVISKCIELYPESLATADEHGHLPLHTLLMNKLSCVNAALLIIDKYPGALKHRGNYGHLPYTFEHWYHFRPSILLKCIELYPESAGDNFEIFHIIRKLDKSNFHQYADVISVIIANNPWSAYFCGGHDPYIHRRILNNIVPRHVFALTGDEDYRDLNWQVRAAMIMLLSQMKIQQLQKQQSRQQKGTPSS